MNIELLQSEQFKNQGYSHGFTTRQGGVSPAPVDSLNVKTSALVPDEIENVARNLELAISSFDVTPRRLGLLYLEGGSNVTEITRLDGWMTIYEADGAVTKLDDCAIAITVADCLPILLADKEAGVVGISHAGWKGSAGRVTTKVVEQMIRLGAEPRRIVAAIGPGICANCYEVGTEIASQFRDEFVLRDSKKPHLDIRQANISELTNVGINQIDNIDICTHENTDRFFSARAEGQTGRFLALVSNLNNQ